LIILLERPIKVGDRIAIENLAGDVVRIAGRSTWIQTNDNVIIIVPNSEFISSRVTNLTANERTVRFGLKVGVSYASDPEEVRAVLVQTAKSHPDVLQDPPPDVVFTGFGDSSLDFELRVWTTKRLQTPQVLRSDLYFSIFRVFRERRIEIPFPQRDLHLRSAAVPLPVDAKVASLD
jgi:small-conductance mechanosensitive channel